MLQCPMDSVVTMPYLPMCCVQCYVATIVPLDARYRTLRSSFWPHLWCFVVAMAGGLCRLRRRKRSHCGRW